MTFDYPTAQELESFLEAAGITITDGGALQGLFASAVEQARAEFENAVDRVMQAEETATERVFDPPTGGGSVLFIDDLAAAPTSVVYQPEGSSAETLTLRTDYWLEPANALAKGEPITMIRFRRRWTTPLSGSLLQSIEITGRWGYATTLPADAHQAILMRAAANVWAQFTQAETGGRLGVKEGDAAIDYGVETWKRLLDVWVGGDGRSGVYGATVARYRRLTF